MKILVVDDEPIAVQGVVDSVDFKKLGFCAVYTAECHTEAVEVLLNQINSGAEPQMYELESRVIVRESTINFISGSMR